MSYEPNLATLAGFEPANAGIKVRCLRPLGDRAMWCSRRDSNPRDLIEDQASSPLDDRNKVVQGGAPGRVRACDAQLFKLPLYRLSYGGEIGVRGRSRTGIEGFAVLRIAALPPGPDWCDKLCANSHEVCRATNFPRIRNWRPRQDSNLRLPGSEPGAFAAWRRGYELVLRAGFEPAVCRLRTGRPGPLDDRSE